MNGIIGGGKITFNTLLKAASIDGDFQRITPQDIKDLGPRIKLKGAAPPIHGFLTIRGLNFAQYLCFYRDRSVEHINRIFMYLPFLDTELIRRLNAILHSEYFQLCDGWLRNVDLFTDPDLTSFDQALQDYHEAIQSLEEYSRHRQ